MEIKHTIEILTKDIQDIEKLVGNLQNSPDGSVLELDLALSKLRNVYDMLTMIKTDMLIARNQPMRHEASPPDTDQDQTAKDISEAAPEPVVNDKSEERKEPGILAEKFSSESSINENMAGQRAAGVDNSLLGEPIDNISRNIGINDRFLIIRELFDGDGEGFNRLVGDLDNAGNYQDAVKCIEEKFSAAIEHEGISILMGLTKRKFIR